MAENVQSTTTTSTPNILPGAPHPDSSIVCSNVPRSTTQATPVIPVPEHYPYSADDEVNAAAETLLAMSRHDQQNNPTFIAKLPGDTSEDVRARMRGYLPRTRFVYLALPKLEPGTSADGVLVNSLGVPQQNREQVQVPNGSPDRSSQDGADRGVPQQGDGVVNEQGRNAEMSIPVETSGQRSGAELSGAPQQGESAANGQRRNENMPTRNMTGRRNRGQNGLREMWIRHEHEEAERNGGRATRNEGSQPGAKRRRR